MHHDIDLTKKGEAYALRHQSPAGVHPLNPTGAPAGVEPRLWRQVLSARVETHLALATALLSVLDGLDGDCDLEDGGDLESSLGGAELHYQVDLEAGDILDERHDGELDLGEFDPLDAGEQMFATCENVDQSLPQDDGGWHFDEMEADYFFELEAGRVSTREANEEDNLGVLAIRAPDGTIINDREGSGMTLDGITDDHGICDSDALSDPSMAFHPLGDHGGRAIAAALLGGAV